MNPDTIPSSEVSASEGQSNLIRFLGLILFVALVVTIFFYSEARTLGKDPNKEAQAKITALVEKVGKIIALPEGEVPTIALVTDLAPLAKNAFFAKAKVGDEALFYPVAQKAFLYDPRENRIVEVASMNIGK